MANAISVQEQGTEATKQPPRRMTWEEWLEWAPDNRVTEWVDGEVIEMSPVSRTHDTISRWLITVLGLFLRKNYFGELAAAPSAMRFSTTQRAREPDLMFIAAENSHHITPTYVEGPVDAIWEIVSPESVIRDWHEKYREYETEGVREYWIVDPEQQRVELFKLGESGRYESVPAQDGKLASTVIPGFYLRPEWLWSEPLPMELDILRELGVL